MRRHQAEEQQHQIWGMDFHTDASSYGSRLNFLNLIDEHIRLYLAIRVA